MTSTASPAADAKNPGPMGRRILAFASWGLLLFAAAFLVYNAGLANFLTYFLLGLPQGGIIAMIAMGYSMVYGIILLINFAHGEVFMFSAFLTLALVVPLDFGGAPWARSLMLLTAVMAFCLVVALWVGTENLVRSRGARVAIAGVGGCALTLLLNHLFKSSVPFWAAVAISAAITPAIGVTIDRVAYRPLRNAPRLIPLITAIGVSLFMMNLAQMIFGTSDFRIPDERLPGILQPYYPDWSQPEPVGIWNTLVETRTLVLPVGRDSAGDPEVISIQVVDLIILALSVVMMTAITAFIHRTKTGTAMRACALDQRMARLVGIDVNRTVAITFALGSMLAAIATPFYVIKYAPINPTMGYIVGILAFSSAVLGGIGNIRGAMLGGMLIGVIYNFVPLFESTANWPFVKWLASLPAFAGVKDWNFLAGISEWRLGIAYVFMILVLVFRPQGLLGQAAAARRA